MYVGVFSYSYVPDKFTQDPEAKTTDFKMIKNKEREKNEMHKLLLHKNIWFQPSQALKVLSVCSPAAGRRSAFDLNPGSARLAQLTVNNDQL